MGEGERTLASLWLMPPLRRRGTATLLVSRASRLQHRGEADPERDRGQSEAAEDHEHRGIAENLRDPAADRRTERSAEALHGHDRALADIDAAGAVENAGDKPGTATLCSPAPTPSSICTG